MQKNTTKALGKLKKGKKHKIKKLCYVILKNVMQHENMIPQMKQICTVCVQFYLIYIRSRLI